MSVQSVEMNINSPKKIRTDSIVEDYDNQDSPVQKLNDYCLIQIFELLPVADRVRMEKVNKNWRNLAKQSWNKVKNLQLTPETLGLRPFNFERNHNIDEYVFESLLIRCGRYLERISCIFFGCCLRYVAKYCPNIQFVSCTASAEGILILAENCKSLKECYFYKLEKTKKFYDALECLFSTNKNLQVKDDLHFRTITADTLKDFLVTKWRQSIKPHTINMDFIRHLWRIQTLVDSGSEYQTQKINEKRHSYLN